MVNSYEDVLGWIGDETTRLFDIAIQSASLTNNIFVELGTYRGKSSIYLYDKIVESGKEVTLYTVDNWTGVLPHDLPEDNNRDIFLNNKGTRSINLIDNDSILACDLFESESIDFLFVDNNAQGDTLHTELLKWYPKVKSNGIISGHDHHWPQIQEVVDTLFPSRSVIVESQERTREFEYQPEKFHLTCWYIHKE